MTRIGYGRCMSKQFYFVSEGVGAGQTAGGVSGPWGEWRT